MAKQGKRYLESQKLFDVERKYNPTDALDSVSKFKKAKFDETVDISIRLGVDPKQADQIVRGSVSLPHGTGKTVRVLVLAKGEKDKEGRDAGADHVGAEDMIEKIQKGWLEFDRVIATPDFMGAVGKLGAILGPRGLMPNPKMGTVTFEVAKAVKEVKGGRVDYRTDKAGVVHAILGKASFGAGKLKENMDVLMDAIVKAKPATSKGVYVRSVTVSTTMGPGIGVDTTSYMTGA